MGLAISHLREGYFSLKALFAEIKESNDDFNAILGRITSNPGTPVPNPTTSFWLENPPFPELVDVQSPKLPESADIVIVGSGITGASVVRTILQECEKIGTQKTVVMLEARQLCSGATGRNGGHIRTSPHEAFRSLKTRFGAARARAIIEFEKQHLPLLQGLAKAEELKFAELREVETADLFTEEDVWQDVQKRVKELREELPDAAKDIRVWDGVTAHEKLHTSNHILGAIAYRSGALWPYRLVASILSSLLSKYSSKFSIDTNTAVESISIGTNPEAPFHVHTPRGDIIASQVIHATNGHSAALIPGLVGKLFPVRGQVTAQRPGKSFPHFDGTMSWSIGHKKGGLEYITQRPGVLDSVNGQGGELMLGGALMQSGGRGFGEVGVSSDAELNFNVGVYLGGVLPMVFGTENWGADADGGRVKNMWTGIMGYTIDALPFVGKLEPGLTGRGPPKIKSSREKSVAPAEWIAAGYNGEGMVNAWLCGVAVGLMVLGRDNVELEAGPGMPGEKVADWLPAEYVISRDRLARASVYELATML